MTEPTTTDSTGKSTETPPILPAATPTPQPTQTTRQWPRDAAPNLPSYGPLEEAGDVNVVNALLKHPGRLAFEIHNEKGRPLALQLLILAAACLVIYGLVMGSFSGGLQWLWSPLKLAGGLAISAAICFPSLYIFSCLSGVDISARSAAQTLLGSLGLVSLLLVGLAPVAWVFSTSTETVGLMGFLHLLFWGVAFFFGMRFLLVSYRLKSGRPTPHLIAWIIIFALVCLQMSTTLRPILGKSDTPFTDEKRFFIHHWFESLETASDGGSRRYR